MIISFAATLKKPRSRYSLRSWLLRVLANIKICAGRIVLLREGLPMAQPPMLAMSRIFYNGRGLEYLI